MLLGRLHSHVLVHPRQLLDPRIKEHKIVQQLNKPLLVAHLQQILIQLEARVIFLILLPLEVILFRRPNGAVLESLTVIPRKEILHRAVEPLIEFLGLVGNILAHAITNRHATVLELNHTHRNAIEVKHHVGPALVVALEGHLLGHGKVVCLRLLPVNELNRLGILTRTRLYRHPVTQQAVDCPVVVIQTTI